MFTLYLVRHAEYSNPKKILAGRLPLPLSKKGINQSKKLANFFSTKNIDTIYSSAVLRCQQTTEIISNHQIPIIYDQRLLESMSAYQGYWVMDSRHFFGHRHQLGGESNQDIQNRMIDFYLSTKFKTGHSYIICSHGDPLYFLYQYFLDQPVLPELELDKPPFDYPGYQPKASIRPVKIDHHKFTILPLITPDYGIIN